MKKTVQLSKYVMNTFGFLGLIFILSACSSSGTDEHEAKIWYQAIAKEDTANLKIKLTDRTFYGQLEINYNGQFKDSGEVSGIVKGDSLLGTYNYEHYGIKEPHRIPIALIKKDKKLIMGVGSMVIYMNIMFFDKKIPVDYQHPKFIFKKINDSVFYRRQLN